MIGDNPYYHRGPIKETTHFFGRDQEVARTLQMVRNGQSVSVVGPRRIGKTSLLLHLGDSKVRAAHGLDQEKALFVYLDGQMLSGLAASQILRIMLERAAAQAGENGADLTQIVDGPSFEQAIREWRRPGWQIVFLIDEFEYLGNNQNLGDGFFPTLRSLTVQNDVAYITASEIPLLSLLERGGQSHPFFNVFERVHLGLLSEDDARRMIHEPSHMAGVGFSKDTEDLLLDLSGQHPFFLQIACFHAFELSHANAPFDEQTRARLEKLVETDLECHFEYFTSRLSEEEQRTLVRLLETGQSDSSTALESLESKCLIRRSGGKYTCVSRSLAHFVKQRLSTAWAAGVAEGDRRMATVLFADVVGFTTLTEQRLPEEIYEITKRVQRIFVDVVSRHGGKVANFGGDSIMALFGVPTEQPDDGTRAVRAAIEIQTYVAQLAYELEQSKGIKFAVRIGLDTGVVVVGEIGGEPRSEYTALGDAVNLANRMETLAQPGDIVISDHTFQQVRGWFKTEPLGLQQVKGKSRPIKAYRVLEERADKR